jgi:hypothetical protein
MVNIKNFNFNKLDLKLSNSDYWDFFLANDSTAIPTSSGLTSGDCFVVWYDFDNVNIYPNSATTASTIYSLVSWDNAVNTGYTFNTIGLTGIDNGLITFNKDPLDYKNDALVNALTGSTLIIPSGETRFMMHLVTGTTDTYIYPTERVTGGTEGDYVQFCGGFYQGYYKIDGSTYEVLPTRVNQAWSAEFWINPKDICTSTGTTLNDTYPNNAGFFFYMGTRAENKFWNQFEGNNTGCLSACSATTTACTGTVTTFCTVLKEPDVSIVGDYGFAIPLDPPQIEIELITNPFLIYGRAYDASPSRLTGATDSFIFTTGVTSTTNNNYSCYFGSTDGLGTKTVHTYDGKGISVARSTEVMSDYTNPFLVYGRGIAYSASTCCGGPNDGFGNKTVYTYSGDTKPQTEVDYRLDIIDNALGFRITSDGKIGYRMLTVTGDCSTNASGERLYTSGVTIQEGYSEAGIMSSDTWSYVTIRYVTNYLTDCELQTKGQRLGKLIFYVNSKLKYVVNEFPEHMAKRLSEYKAKQVGVPFNFSLGGGSQGLIDTQTFDGPDAEDSGLPIEANFGGTFIGGISQFKFNICDLTYADIQYNYNLDVGRYS